MRASLHPFNRKNAERDSPKDDRSGPTLAAERHRNSMDDFIRVLIRKRLRSRTTTFEFRRRMLLKRLEGGLQSLKRSLSKLPLKDPHVSISDPCQPMLRAGVRGEVIPDAVVRPVPFDGEALGPSEHVIGQGCIGHGESRHAVPV